MLSHFFKKLIWMIKIDFLNCKKNLTRKIKNYKNLNDPQKYMTLFSNDP